METLGPYLWRVLHTVAFSLPPGTIEVRKREEISRFLDAMPGIFTCEECVGHFATLMRDMPPDFSSAEAFARWTVAAHNSVNSRLGKPTVSYEEAITIHSPEQGRCPPPCNQFYQSTLAQHALVTERDRPTRLTPFLIALVLVTIGMITFFAVRSVRRHP